MSVSLILTSFTILMTHTAFWPQPTISCRIHPLQLVSPTSRGTLVLCSCLGRTSPRSSQLSCQHCRSQPVLQLVLQPLLQLLDPAHLPGHEGGYSAFVDSTAGSTRPLLVAI